MDQKNYEVSDQKNLKEGIVHLVLFALLIIAGIVVKRVYGHPEYMMLFHGPAAVFLIVGGLKVTARQRRYFKDFKIDQGH
jgi:archaellum biogenesis protein FlaJ (TadC family)